ncbi:unnamed protein product [Heligmosomoides polygyrus]|uniref:SPX domain-containing protein n=1 Tax=Heligmosomoides polygyrus TaxID=6339 RepID=A0A183F9R5_HELPZ|nr:unnamed protein product [Heligmosomoides polygyrus]
MAQEFNLKACKQRLSRQLNELSNLFNEGKDFKEPWAFPTTKDPLLKYILTNKSLLKNLMKRLEEKEESIMTNYSNYSHYIELLKADNSDNGNSMEKEFDVYWEQKEADKMIDSSIELRRKLEVRLIELECQEQAVTTQYLSPRPIKEEDNQTIAVNESTSICTSLFQSTSNNAPTPKVHPYFTSKPTHVRYPAQAATKPTVSQTATDTRADDKKSTAFGNSKLALSASVEDTRPSNATNQNAIVVEAHITLLYVIGLKGTEEVNDQPTSEHRVLLVCNANIFNAGHHKTLVLVPRFTDTTTKSINNANGQYNHGLQIDQDLCSHAIVPLQTREATTISPDQGALLPRTHDPARLLLIHSITHPRPPIQVTVYAVADLTHLGLR